MFGKQPLSSAFVKIYADTTSTLIKKVETDERGWVAFEIPLQKFYTIRISKPGFVTKIITVDGHMPKSQETGDYYFEFAMDIFEDIPGLDVSMLKEPVAKIFFNTFTKNFDYDYNYTVKINKDVKSLYKNYELLKKNNKAPSNTKKEEGTTTQVPDGNKNISGVTFSVELLSSGEALEKTSPAFKGIMNVKEYRDTLQYRYYIGEYVSLSAAEKMKENMRSSFPNATIIGFKEGKKLSAEEVFDQIGK